MVFAIARADALERMRRFAFLIMLALALYAGYLYAPDPSSSYITVSIDGHRGVYNSAWLGSMTALLVAAFLGLFGFYLVRGAVERDRELGTADLVAASSIDRRTFLLAKFLSNLSVLLLIAVAMFAADIVMQLVRREDPHIELGAYALPFFLSTIPGMAIVAAVAVVFDVVKPLRGLVGAIIYIFLATALIAVPLSLSSQGTRATPFDPFGMTALSSQMAAAAKHTYPQVNLRNMEVGVSGAPAGGVRTFVFGGVQWSTSLILARAAWFFVAVMLVIASAPLFDRFRRESNTSQTAKFFSVDIARIVPNVSFLRIFRAELALLVNGTSVWWLGGGVGLCLVGAFLPTRFSLLYAVPLALIWPIERWSTLGSRESRWNVAQLLSSTPRYASQTLLLQWLAATALGIVLILGFVVRLAIGSQLLSVLACLTTVAAICAAALACGVVSRTSRLFEAGFLLLWYVGPVNHLPFLDFSGAIVGAPAKLLVISAGVAALALIIAWRARATVSA